MRILTIECAGDPDKRARVIALLEASDASTLNVLRLTRDGKPGPDIRDEKTPAISEPGLALPKDGDRIADYTIVREIDRGGMGVVFLAHHEKLARKVAIKWLLSTETDLRQRFMREAKATARCRHENIVVIYDVDEHEGQPYIVFEYLQGQTLGKWLREQPRPLSLSDVLDIVIPVLRAIIHVHEQDVVHRDLKPDNIMITEGRRIKVLDFSIAKVLSSAYAKTISSGGLPKASKIPLTQQGAILGTLPYMSPEQWGADAIDHRTDIWSLGILMYELANGRHPLAPLDLSRLQQIPRLDIEMPGLSVAEHDLQSLAGLIERCLRKRKCERISARELLKELRSLRDSPPPRHFARLPTDPGYTLPATMITGSPREAISKFLLRSSIPKTSYKHTLDGYRILAVDDEPYNSEHSQKVLRSCGAEVHVAEDPYRALELLKTHEFDVMLTDQLMPGLLGTELAVQVGAKYPELVVVLVTGYDDDPVVVESLRSPDSPVVDVIAKPFSNQALPRRVMNACDRAFKGLARQFWPDNAATLPVLLDSRETICQFMERYGSSALFQSAVRHKMKDYVHKYAGGVVIGEAGLQSANLLRSRLMRLEQLMARIDHGRTRGLASYLEAKKQDLVEDFPGLEVTLDVASSLSVLENHTGVQALLMLSAVELIDNAINALGAKGQIRVQLRERASTRAVSLKVWSDSPRIDDALAERIFDEGVSTKGEGRGMGLAIIKSMARRFRGKVQLIQHDGVSFLVTIPLPDEPGRHTW